jgi:hypothetical protein
MRSRTRITQHTQFTSRSVLSVVLHPRQGSGANSRRRGGSAFQRESKDLRRREPLPRFQGQLLVSYQLSDFELILLNLFRKLNAGDRHRRSIESLESKHRADPLLNPAMVLFDDIVQVLTGSNPDSTRHSSCRFQFVDCSMLCCACVKRDNSRCAVILYCIAKEAFCCGNISQLAQ